jgi:anti-anti-sigma factor
MSDKADASGVVVRPGRDIVASSVEEFRAEWKRALAPGTASLTVDLDGVEMIDSVGLGLLIATHNTLGKAGGKLRVSGASPDILGLFRTMRLDKHFILEG